MSEIRFISVDFQKDFTFPSGKFYIPRQSVDFVKETLVPFLMDKKIKVAEIVSDYRQPRPGDTRDCCRPGEDGFESEIPTDAKISDVWIKSHNSPAWTREGIGDGNSEPGPPVPDSHGFTAWLHRTIGPPEGVEWVVLFGLALDRCILSTAQVLCFRGYKVWILGEGTDTQSGNREEKERLLNGPPITHWSDPISWERLNEML
jgi:nicotinamidase-related amidase